MKYVVPVTRVTYPYVIALAYALPMMHQSSLGALMLLGRIARSCPLADAVLAASVRLGGGISRLRAA